MRATRNRAIYTNEFKVEAVALARRDDRSFRELAEDLGVNVWTLRDGEFDRSAQHQVPSELGSKDGDAWPS